MEVKDLEKRIIVLEMMVKRLWRERYPLEDIKIVKQRRMKSK